MDGGYQRYKEEIESLEQMLEGVWDIIGQIAKRMENRALLTYPNEADVSDLNDIHERLTNKAQEIIDKMQSLHKEFNDR